MAPLTLILALTVVQTAPTPSRALHVPVPASLISLDPTSVQDQSSLWVARHVHCQLVRLKQGKVVPEAVESYRYLSPTSIEMTLGTRYRFHDGRPITAEDVRATFEYLRTSRSVLRNIFDWLSEVRAPEPNKVVFELVRPVPQFLRVLSAPNYALLQSDFLQEAAQNPTLWQTPLGCGTYRIGTTNAEVIHMLPVQPGPRTVVFHLRSGRNITAKEMDEFDIVSFGLEPPGPPASGFREERLFDPYHIILGLNTRVAPWGDRRKRCELFSRLDATSAAAGYEGEAEVATELIPRGALGYSEKVNYPAELRVHKRAHPPKKSMRISFLSVSIPENRRDWYLAILGNAGVQTTATTIDGPKHYAIQFQQAGTDALFLGLKSNYLDAYEYLLLLSERDANFTGYWDAGLQEAIRRSQDLADAEHKAQAYRDILSHVRRECLLYPVLTLPSKKVLVRRNLNTPGLGTSPLNDYYLGDVL